MSINGWEPAPALPGFAPAERSKHSVIWPCWSGSVDVENIRCFKPTPLTDKEKQQLRNAAYDWEWKTRTPGKRGGFGVLGRAALAGFKALLDCEKGTGKIYPKYTTLAKKADYCPRTMWAAAQRLKALGMIAWTKRCYADENAPRRDGGRFVKRQTSNWYTILSPANWLGYRKPPPPPWTPKPGTWGDHPPMPEMSEAEDAAVSSTITAGGDPAQNGATPSDGGDAAPGGLPLSKAEVAALTDAESRAYYAYLGQIEREGMRLLQQAPERFEFTIEEFCGALMEDDPPPWVRAECDRLAKVIAARRRSAGADSPISREPPRC